MWDLTGTFILIGFVAKVIFNKLIGFLSRTVVPREKKTVTIEQGSLQGKYYKTRLSNKPYVSFLGIPYAKPPVGDLRFMPPVKHPGWSGVLKAFSEGDKCMQIDIFEQRLVGSEDCLYLNVFVPQEQPDEKKAVMVFIHGGAFNFGSGSLDEHSPDYLLDENVIVVTINYRLNVLGFLNFEIDECPGNMGLKDQLLALKWTKENIREFGGDADNITIFGESAGSASVHCHIMSPQSTGLFQRAIMQSGCMFNSWAFNNNHLESAFEFVKKLGCQKDDPREIIQYLKTVPAAELVKFAKSKKNIIDFSFIPSVESDTVNDRFLSASPEILLKTALPVPLITGVNNMEGLIVFDKKKMQSLYDFPHRPERINKFLSGQYNEDTINKIKNYYFNESNLECETTNIENICHFNSDAFFVKDYHRGFNNFLEKDVTPVYMYEFKFDGEINRIKNMIFLTRPKLRQSIQGACHADELSYLFYGEFFGFSPKVNSPESKMCKTMCRLWSNFAKTGNPNSPDLSFEWKSTSSDDPKYLSIDGDDTCMVNELLYGSRINLWKNNPKIKT